MIEQDNASTGGVQIAASAIPGVSIRYAGQTDVGKRRPNNEDAFGVLADELLFVLADGMGGHAGGEVASRMAVDAVLSFFRETANIDEAQISWPFPLSDELSPPQRRLVSAIKLANHKIHRFGERDAAFHGMGTTVVALCFDAHGAYLAHVGDSRIYCMTDASRGGILTPLTEDHSLLNAYLRQGKLTAEQAENFPFKNVLVRALGTSEGVSVDVAQRGLRTGDLYVLTSDGVHDVLGDDEMERILRTHRADLGRACGALVDAGNRRGGPDNLTVVLVEVTESS